MTPLKNLIFSGGVSSIAQWASAFGWSTLSGYFITVLYQGTSKQEQSVMKALFNADRKLPLNSEEEGRDSVKYNWICSVGKYFMILSFSDSITSLLYHNFGQLSHTLDTPILKIVLEILKSYRNEYSQIYSTSFSIKLLTSICQISI